MKGVCAFLAVLVAVTVVSVACAPAAAPAPTAAPPTQVQAATVAPTATSGKPIVLGAYAGATGVLKVYGSYEDEGWQLAQVDLNKQGGILGRPVEIRFQDDASDKDQARSIMERFVASPEIIGVMGPTSTANAFASHPVAVKARLPVIAVSNNAQGVVEQGEVIWRISIPEERLQPAVTKRVVADLGIKQAAILYAQDDPFSQTGFQAYQSTLKDLGVQIGATVAYSSKTPDFGPQVRQLLAGQPQAVFVAAYAEDAGNFLRQARSGGLNVPIIGNLSFNSPTQLQVAGSAANGVIIGSQWWIDDPDPLNQTFVKAYRAKFNRDPGNFSAMAYNGAFLIKMALEASGDASREGLQKGMQTLKGYRILGAPIKFDNRDSFSDEPLLLMVKDGNYVKFDPKAFK